MKRSTSVRRHSRRGTKGVRQHTREIDSPDANRVPHDDVPQDDNQDEEIEQEISNEEENIPS